MKQLEKVERGLSVKQIVLLYINEYRQFPRMMDHAMAMVGHEPPFGTICEQIDRSMAAQAKGRSKADHNAAVRKAQADGVFLGRLSMECNSRIVLEARERQLETSLLAAQVCLLLRTSEETPDSTMTIQVWLSAAG